MKKYILPLLFLFAPSLLKATKGIDEDSQKCNKICNLFKELSSEKRLETLTLLYKIDRELKPPHQVLGLLPFRIPNELYIIRRIRMEDIECLQQKVKEKDDGYYRYYHNANCWKQDKERCKELINNFSYNRSGGCMELVIAREKDERDVIAVISLQGFSLLPDQEQELKEITLGYYRLDESKETKGIMTKAVCAFSDKVIDLECTAVLHIDPNNLKSQKVALASGFELKGSVSQFNNKSENHLVYKKDKKCDCKKITNSYLAVHAIIPLLLEKALKTSKES